MYAMSGKTIGIIGGGQLGRMLTLAAKPMGFDVIVLDPGENAPATHVGASQIVGGLYDKKALQQLVEQADYITAEIEHMDAAALQELERLQKPINPAPATIRLIQDKYKQKEFLRANGVAVADFVAIESEADAKKALNDFGGKMLLKTRHGAYDGRGNMVVKSPKDVKDAFKKFGDTPLYAEKFVPFTQEIAVMVARSTTSEVATYPVVQTIQQRNICLEVLAPAPVPESVIKQAMQLARKTAKLLKGAGTFGIEMFVTTNGKVLINEIAPRVHNSGHYTIEACRTSQFEQHVRAVTGLPLGDTSMVTPAAVMINILGERDGPTQVTGLDNMLATPHTSVHIYGKSPTKVDRKMGHITQLRR